MLLGQGSRLLGYIRKVEGYSALISNFRAPWRVAGAVFIVLERFRPISVDIVPNPWFSGRKMEFWGQKMLSVLENMDK